MPSAVKQGMSQRMCDPRKSSADPRNGALGVRRRFCFARMPTTGLLSKIDTKLGIWVLELLFHWSWSGRESSESGVALREREPVLQVYRMMQLKVNQDDHCKVLCATHLNITKHVTNVRLFSSISRSRSSTYRPIQSLDSQFHRLGMMLRQSRQNWYQLRRGLFTTLYKEKRKSKIERSITEWVECWANRSIFTRQSCQDMLCAADTKIN